MIYVIGEHRRGVVKIGTAADPIKRLREVKQDHPGSLAVQLALPGGRIEERALHRRFAPLAIGHEWFDFEERDAVAEVFAAAPVVNERHAERIDLDRLLADLPEVFAGARRLASRELVDRLVARGWDFTSTTGGGRQVADALRGLGATPTVMKIDGRATRGYEWAHLARHCSSTS